jgi:disulfide bond formation protein DsbB
MKVSHTLLLAFAAGALALALAACGQSEATPTKPGISAEAEQYASLTGDASAGKTKYDSACIACHGPDAKGVPGLGKDLTTSEFAKALPDAEFILFITKGRPAGDPANTTGIDMPPRGGNPAFTDQDLADIVAYVRTLQQ